MPWVVGVLAFSIKGWCTVCIMSLIKVLRFSIARPILVVRFLKSFRRLGPMLAAFSVSRFLLLTLCSTRWSSLSVVVAVLSRAPSRVPRRPNSLLSCPRRLRSVVPRLGRVVSLFVPGVEALGVVPNSFFRLNMLPTRSL